MEWFYERCGACGFAVPVPREGGRVYCVECVKSGQAAYDAADRAGVPVVETVAEYNSRHVGKAWSIVAMTLQGAAYCAECSAGWPCVGDLPEWLESPAPIFSSDELCGDPCDGCLTTIA